MPNFLGPVILAVIITGFTVVSLVGAGVLRPSRDIGAKLMAYESGLPPTGDTRGQHQVKFYMVAMLFVAFDLELVFLYPWAVHFASLTDQGEKIYMAALMTIFVIFLAVADLVAWKLGVFDWAVHDD